MNNAQRSASVVAETISQFLDRSMRELMRPYTHFVLDEQKLSDVEVAVRALLGVPNGSARFDTGLTAGYLRSRGEKVPEHVPDCAALWARKMTLGECTAGPSDPSTLRLPLAFEDVEWCWVDVTVPVSSEKQP